jgi:hypothetical protein
MTGSRLNIRAGPGTEYPVLGKALPDEVFVVLARNGPATWVQLEVAEVTGGLGWVNVTFVELTVPVLDLPISTETSNAPVVTVTPTPDRLVSTTQTTVNTQPLVQRTAPTGLSGRLVIQSGWGSTFYLYDLGSGTLRPLSGGFDPALSPDGAQVVFTREGNDQGVYLINSDGSGERRIFGERHGLRSPKWSPDGKWIVFSRTDGTYNCRDLGFGGICPSEDQLRADIPRPDLPPNALPPNCDAACKAQIEQGLEKEIERKVISGFDREQRPNWMLARVGVDGKEYRDLPALNSARAPDWNSAGIVYTVNRGLQKTEDKPAAETQPITNEAYSWDPDWQPGGPRIVFQAKRGSHWQIFVINSDGGGLAALTRPATALVDQLPSSVAPAWSPDGQFIVFLSNREENGEAGRWRVWVMNADGSNQRPLPVDVPITYTFNLEQMVDWSR